MYAIKIDKTGRYIDWCNSSWYATEKEPMYKFTRDDCQHIYDLLEGHYVYTITLVDTDGNEEHLSRLKNNIVKMSTNGIPTLIKVAEQVEGAPVKKSIFKLSFSSIKK